MIYIKNVKNRLNLSNSYIFVSKKYYHMKRIMFHTQEHRTKQLKKPKECLREDAWLGDAYYFWYDEFDADRWGHTSKNKNGKYEVYKAEIDCENTLNTVFDEEHYLFWLTQIEKVALILIKKTKEKPTLKEINDYFKEKGNWDELDGILFQDLPTNLNSLLVKPIQYRNKKVPFVYRKRIQIAIYNLEIIGNFNLYKVEDCI